MTQQFNTASGPVVLEPMGSSKWGVFAPPSRGALIGIVEKSGDTFLATPEGGRAIPCKSLDEAVQIVGA